LKAETSGGAESGKAVCEWNWQNSWIRFLETASNMHKQTGLELNQGLTNIPIRCTDAAGNIAQANANIIIVLDNSYPQVIRVLRQGNLKITTDEDAECAYSNENCEFYYENATKMTGLLREHTIGFELGKTYYVKCRDLFNNKPDGCSVIVRPVEGSGE